ncbi:MAG: helix-turn-helix transcriptional regulator [Gammaproteobacteria bacterium]|jgi:DNA-binding CsgD family transcriptional regulator
MTRAQEFVVILVLSVVGMANLYDLVIDLSYGTTAGHLVAEALMIVMSLSVIVWLLLNLHVQKKELEQIRLEIAAAKNRRMQMGAEGQEVRSKLGGLIRRQFQDWQLTGGEQEVALLLLKGLSFKEIAAVRDTHEKTVRQQASAIYRKSGVNGRHAFSAWFIEDFL